MCNLQYANVDEYQALASMINICSVERKIFSSTNSDKD